MGFEFLVMEIIYFLSVNISRKKSNSGSDPWTLKMLGLGQMGRPPRDYQISGVLMRAVDGTWTPAVKPRGAPKSRN